MECHPSAGISQQRQTSFLGLDRNRLQKAERVLRINEWLRSLRYEQPDCPSAWTTKGPDTAPLPQVLMLRGWSQGSSGLGNSSTMFLRAVRRHRLNARSYRE